jgi:hypothetical protein
MTDIAQAARRAAMMHALTVPYWRDITHRAACELAYRDARIEGWTERDHMHVVDTLFRLRGMTTMARIAA